MIRSPAYRLIALWAWIVLLLNGSVDGFGVHPCPHHTAIAAASPAAVEHGGAHGHDGAHSPDPRAPAGHDGACTCLGSCALGAAAPLPSPIVLRVAPFLAAHAVPPLEDAPVLSGRRPYVLPYATAPPARLA